MRASCVNVAIVVRIVHVILCVFAWTRMCVYAFENMRLCFLFLNLCVPLILVLHYCPPPRHHSDAGIGKDGKPSDRFTRGMELKGRVTLFAEGCRGSCSESLMKKYNLREGKDPQTYGLGIKEVWQIPQVRRPLSPS